MASLNKVMIIGNVTRQPEIRYSQSGAAVTNFSVACNETWTDKHSGEKKEKVEFLNCVSFGKQAETLEKYLTKGSSVFIEGKITTDQYDKDGHTHYSTKIKVDGFQFLGGKPDGQKQERPAQQERRPEPRRDGPPPMPDDLPF